MLTALEGDFLTSGPSGTGQAQELPSVLVQRELWQRVRQQIESVLSKTTIQDLLQRQQDMTAPVRYYI